RKDGDHCKISSCECFSQGGAGPVFPLSFCILSCTDRIADHLVCLCCLSVNIIQPDRTAHVRLQRQVCHKSPRPSAGSAPDISDLYILYLFVFILHLLLLSASQPGIPCLLPFLFFYRLFLKNIL